ncbi:MAG: hypothetical protein ACREEM_30375 [Blastocatellia bacterium]
MKRLSKKEMVLEIYDREAMGEVTAREIAVINQGLVAEYGEGGAMAPAEIARILREEDLPVRFEQVFRMMTPTEKYENLFDALAYNTSLDQAERAIRRIDELWRGFERQGDQTGVRFALQTARFAKKNAEELANAIQSSGEERRIRAEIARWFTVWLQTPELFPQWLELRKSAREFKMWFETESNVGSTEPGKTGPES